MEDNSKKRHYTVHRRVMDFSQEEIEAILEENIPEGSGFLSKTFEETKEPTEGKCFKVDIETIKQSLPLFLEERKDERQEWTRKIMLEAIIVATIMEPQKYSEPFYLLIPKKEWVYGDKKHITVKEAMDFAEKLGGYTSTWVEKALEWAQRITNGNGSDEAWEAVCNNPDTMKWYNLVVWKKGYAKFVGGSSETHFSVSASYISSDICSSNNKLYSTLPCVVLKNRCIVYCEV